jgi:hypothetical protein
VESRLFELDRRTRTTAAPQDFDTQVGQFVQQVIRSVDADMRRQPASMVYELLRIHVARRLPGIEVDQELLRDAAAKIAAGYPVSTRQRSSAASWPVALTRRGWAGAVLRAVRRAARRERREVRGLRPRVLWSCSSII